MKKPMLATVKRFLNDREILFVVGIQTIEHHSNGHLQNTETYAKVLAYVTDDEYSLLERERIKVWQLPASEKEITHD